MEDSAHPPSIPPALPSTEIAAECSYVPSSTWTTNAQQLLQMSIMQFTNSDGKGITGTHVPIRGRGDDVGTPSSVPAEESAAGLAIPFQQSGTLKPEFVQNSTPQCTTCYDTADSSVPTSVNLPHEGVLQVGVNTPAAAASLSESLHKIEHLALNTSLSLDACCSSESKHASVSTTHNLGTVSAVSIPANSNLSGTSVLQSSFLPRHGVKLQPESSSSVESDTLTFEPSEKPLSQNGISSASCCGCNESVSLNAPGTELSLAIASVVDNGIDRTEDPHSFLSPWNNTQTVSSSNIEKAVSRKDEMFFRLVQQVRELEVQLQERQEWAHQKALQAACKFSKDMSELKSLRLEHEEILCLKRDTQALEDNTMKRLTEMESALRKAGAQVDKANASVRKLETENAELRAEMEAAKLSAAESNAKCQEVAKREKKSSKKIQAWEKQKAKMLDEIVKQKQLIAQAQEQLSNVKIQQHEAEMRWRQEEKAKDDALSLADAEKWAREQLEVDAKRREETWRRKADADFQRHKDDIQRLESELDQLKIAAETCNLELNSGVSVHTMDSNGLQVLKETTSQLLQELTELQDSGDICRDRECVMCMSEESLVVFLPCAHQIVCVNCNDLHQKQGMRDCPSCRTVIQRRIHVVSASAM